MNFATIYLKMHHGELVFLKQYQYIYIGFIEVQAYWLKFY